MPIREKKVGKNRPQPIGQCAKITCDLWVWGAFVLLVLEFRATAASVEGGLNRGGGPCELLAGCRYISYFELGVWACMAGYILRMTHRTDGRCRIESVLPRLRSEDVPQN